MIDWKQLVENGKKCGIEYHFYDDIELKRCSCGGKARMYSKENKKKKFSFEHLFIVCEKCNNSADGVYDISGNPSKMYRTKEEVIKDIAKEWNEKRFNESLHDKVNITFQGIFPGNQNAGNYNWNMPGKRENQ